MTKIFPTQATILLIDDDPLTLTSLATVLNLQGFDCRSALSAEAALAQAQQLPLDLIICDIDINGDNGLELSQRLRQLPGLETVPVMFLSGASIPDVIHRAHEAGAFYYLHKPFDPEVLVELVQKALWMPHLVRPRGRRPVAAL